MIEVNSVGVVRARLCDVAHISKFANCSGLVSNLAIQCAQQMDLHCVKCGGHANHSMMQGDASQTKLIHLLGAYLQSCWMVVACVPSKSFTDLLTTFARASSMV